MSISAQPYLPAVIDWITRGLAMARQLSNESGMDGYQRCVAFNNLVDALGQNMIKKFDAKIGQRGDVVRVVACGVVSTSIQGLNGALRNWIVAAEKKVANCAASNACGIGQSPPI